MAFANRCPGNQVWSEELQTCVINDFFDEPSDDNTIPDDVLADMDFSNITDQTWGSADLYGIGFGAGSIMEEGFGTLGREGMLDSLINWQDDITQFQGDSTSELMGPGLLAYTGSEYEHKEQGYLKELAENYKTMSIDVLSTRAKTFKDKKRSRSVAGKTGFSGSGTIDRMESNIDKAHQDSVYDTYSNYLQDKTGITSDITSARQSWWDFNQAQVESILTSDTF